VTEETQTFSNLIFGFIGLCSEHGELTIIPWGLGRREIGYINSCKFKLENCFMRFIQ